MINKAVIEQNLRDRQNQQNQLTNRLLRVMVELVVNVQARGAPLTQEETAMRNELFELQKDLDKPTQVCSAALHVPPPTLPGLPERD